MRDYESPKFEFEELKLFERVADVCWGTSSAWIDTNKDNQITGADIKIFTSGGCQGDWTAGAINNEIDKYNKMVQDSNGGRNIAIVEQYKPELAQYLSEHSGMELTKIESVATSNWANTKVASGDGIIIVRS